MFQGLYRDKTYRLTEAPRPWETQWTKDKLANVLVDKSALADIRLDLLDQFRVASMACAVLANWVTRYFS